MRADRAAERGEPERGVPVPVRNLGVGQRRDRHLGREHVVGRQGGGGQLDGPSRPLDQRADGERAPHPGRGIVARVAGVADPTDVRPTPAAALDEPLAAKRVEGGDDGAAADGEHPRERPLGRKAGAGGDVAVLDRRAEGVGEPLMQRSGPERPVAQGVGQVHATLSPLSLNWLWPNRPLSGMAPR